MLRISANSTIRALDVRLWRPWKAKEDVRTEVWRWHITLWMQFVDQRYYCRNSQHRKHIFMENKITWITVIQLEISPYPFQIWNIKIWVYEPDCIHLLAFHCNRLRWFVTSSPVQGLKRRIAKQYNWHTKRRKWLS
jgi:hypothetical protein